jgi:hypothetical protein
MKIIEKLVGLLKRNFAPSTDSSSYPSLNSMLPYFTRQAEPSPKTHAIHSPQRVVTTIQSTVFRKSTINVTTNGYAFLGKQVTVGLSQSQLGTPRRDGYRHGQVDGVRIRWKEGEYRYFELKNAPASLRSRVGACGHDNGQWYRVHVTSCEIRTFHHAVELARTGLQGNIEHRKG